MTLFWQGAAAVLVAVVLLLTLGKQGKEAGMLLSLAVCCMLAVLALTYLKPVIELTKQLQQMVGLDREMFQILLKAVAIGIIGEIAGLICTDTGNAALGKAMQLLSASVVLWLSVPMIEALLELLKEMLGEV